MACVDVPRSPRAILELSEGRPFFPRPLWVAERSSLFSYPSHVCGVETSRARSGVARSAGWGCVIHTHTNGPPPCTSFAPLTICFPSPQVGGMKTAVSETRAPSFSLRSASPSPRKRARLALSYPSLLYGEGGWPKASRVGLSSAIEAPPPCTSFAPLTICCPSPQSHEWEG